MLEDLKRSEANRKSHVCPEQPLAHLFSENAKPAEPERVPRNDMAQYAPLRNHLGERDPWAEPAVTINALPPDHEDMVRRTDKRDLISEMGYAPAVG